MLDISLMPTSIPNIINTVYVIMLYKIHVCCTPIGYNLHLNIYIFFENVWLIETFICSSSYVLYNDLNFGVQVGKRSIYIHFLFILKSVKNNVASHYISADIRNSYCVHTINIQYKCLKNDIMIYYDIICVTQAYNHRAISI